VRTYGEYLLKGEAVYEVFILLVCYGFISGFKINYTGQILQLDTKQIKSVLQYPMVAYERVNVAHC
jgi:hypothetical protein